MTNSNIIITHQSYLGLLFVNYSWILGMAGGLIMSWLAFNWNKGLRANPFVIAVALALVFGGVLNVMAEVNQPGRLLWTVFGGISNFVTARIKIGVLGIGVLLLALAGLLAPKNLQEKYIAPKHLFAIKFGLAALATFITLYSGSFMSSETGIALWNNIAPSIFTMLTGVYTGVMLYSVIMAYLQKSDHETVDTSNVAMYTAYGIFGLSTTTWLMFTWWGYHFADGETTRAFGAMDDNHFMTKYVFLYVIGMMLPVYLFVKGQFKTLKEKSIIFGAMSIGAYAMRFLLVSAGQEVSRSTNAVMEMSITGHSYTYTILSLIFTAGALAGLLYYIEYCDCYNNWTCKHAKNNDNITPEHNTTTAQES